MRADQQGLVLIEVMVVVVVAMFLLAGMRQSFYVFWQQDNLDNSVDHVVRVLEKARHQAVTRESGGTGMPQAFGVRLEEEQVVLFTGSSYSPGDSNNEITELAEIISITQIGFDPPQVVFSSVTGEVQNWVDGDNYLILENSETEQEVRLEVNRWGIVERS